LQLFLGHIDGTRFSLEESEVQHCTKVLRKQLNDSVSFITGDGNLYSGIIETLSKKSVSGRYELIEQDWGKVPYSLTVAVAPTKNMDRLETFVEKAVELGITRIVPLLCDHSERKNLKIERLQKIALSATKQSLKGSLPRIDELTPFETLIQNIDPKSALIAHCEDAPKVSLVDAIKGNKGQHWVILIGPEGDFSSKEIKLAMDNGITPIHLGSSRLRTETAALAAVTMVYGEHL
jgi:16S rRNA (uracil1498-N3)-methyltransferase